jgi:cyclic beta-1,2-glucan synthetase
MYRAGIESVLGFTLRGDRLQINPCIPRGWREYELVYKRGSTHYHLLVENPLGLNRGAVNLELDGQPVSGTELVLVDDGKEHAVRITLEVGI